MWFTTCTVLRRLVSSSLVVSNRLWLFDQLRNCRLLALIPRLHNLVLRLILVLDFNFIFFHLLSKLLIWLLLGFGKHVVHWRVQRYFIVLSKLGFWLNPAVILAVRSIRSLLVFLLWRLNSSRVICHCFYDSFLHVSHLFILTCNNRVVVIFIKSWGLSSFVCDWI